MIKEKIYVIGHKSPDTDTVCSAIAYAEFLKKKKLNAIPVIAGEINSETKFVLDYFKIKKPSKLESIKGKKVILVDHNETAQSPDGAEEAEIIEIIDHHKIGCTFDQPINFQTKPLGSTSTLVAQRMLAEKFKITRPLAGILLSAILSDTVIFKSSTTTSEDIKIAKILASIAKIKDIKEFGIEVKKKKSDLRGLSAEKIVCSDFKIFQEGEVKFGIGQVEMVDLTEIKKRKTELLSAMEKVMLGEKAVFLILMMTDIMNEGSELLVSGDASYLAKALKKDIKDNSVYAKGMMSRKKDLVPLLVGAIN
jgi:manganese-dependent inorganic pyrophosphatase